MNQPKNESPMNPNEDEAMIAKLLQEELDAEEAKKLAGSSSMHKPSAGTFHEPSPTSFDYQDSPGFTGVRRPD